MLASAVYLDDGTAGLRDGKPVKWPAPLDKGFTNAVYQALAYTNVGTLRLPTEATLTTFIPNLSEPGPPVVRKFTYEIVTTNLTTDLLYGGDFRPRLPGKTYVSDLRFSTPGNDLHFSYLWDEGSWPTDVQAKRLPEYAAGMAQALLIRTASARLTPKVHRPGQWVTFGLLAALPAVFLLKRKRRAWRRTSTERKQNGSNHWL